MDVPSIEDLTAGVETAEDGRALADQINGMLDALPPDPESDIDYHLRARLEAFAAGLRLGLRLTADH